MQISFEKYQGTGNDFILIEDAECLIEKKLKSAQIKKACDRHFGIGADGLIFLQKHKTYDFTMSYFNSDGKRSSMCGNGARCLVHFAMAKKWIRNSCNFMAFDGMHSAKINAGGIVSLQMSDVEELKFLRKDVFLDTGSPHFVRFVDQLKGLDIVKKGRSIRESDRFKKDGTNVNFVKNSQRITHVATYERGVEDETLSCGTGVVASVLASHKKEYFNSTKRKVATKGGSLEVHFEPTSQGYKGIWLIGPVQKVFEGVLQF